MKPRGLFWSFTKLMVFYIIQVMSVVIPGKLGDPNKDKDVPPVSGSGPVESGGQAC